MIIARVVIALRSYGFPPCLASIIASDQIRSDGWIYSISSHHASERSDPESSWEIYLLLCVLSRFVSSAFYKCYSNLNESVGDKRENKRLLGLNKVIPWRRHCQLQLEATPKTVCFAARNSFVSLQIFNNYLEVLMQEDCKIFAYRRIYLFILTGKLYFSLVWSKNPELAFLKSGQPKCKWSEGAYV